MGSLTGKEDATAVFALGHVLVGVDLDEGGGGDFDVAASALPTFREAHHDFGSACFAEAVVGFDQVFVTDFGGGFVAQGLHLGETLGFFFLALVVSDELFVDAAFGRGEFRPWLLRELAVVGRLFP